MNISFTQTSGTWRHFRVRRKWFWSSKLHIEEKLKIKNKNDFGITPYIYICHHWQIVVNKFDGKTIPTTTIKQPLELIFHICTYRWARPTALSTDCWHQCRFCTVQSRNLTYRRKRNMLDNLKPDKACGSYLTWLRHVNILQNCRNCDLPWSVIFNESLETSQIPQD